MQIGRNNIIVFSKHIRRKGHVVIRLSLHCQMFYITAGSIPSILFTWRWQLIQMEWQLIQMVCQLSAVSWWNSCSTTMPVRAPFWHPLHEPTYGCPAHSPMQRMKPEKTADPITRQPATSAKFINWTHGQSADPTAKAINGQLMQLLDIQFSSWFIICTRGASANLELDILLGQLIKQKDHPSAIVICHLEHPLFRSLCLAPADPCSGPLIG